MKKKIVAFIISFIFIVYLYSFVRLQEIVSVFHNSSLLILFSGIILFVPTIILSSYRFMILASPTIKLKFSKCFELTMQASFMNLFLPSKMGDIIKSVFISQHLRLSNSLSLVIFEKFLDLTSLLVVFTILLLIVNFNVDKYLIYIAYAIPIITVCFCLLIFSKTFSKTIFSMFSSLFPKNISIKIIHFNNDWLEVQKLFLKDFTTLLNISFISLIIWIVHLLQIWLFAFSLNDKLDILPSSVANVFSIFFGLMPFTIAGIGSRDAAIVYLYTDVMSFAASVSLGILCSLRYIIPAIIGFPFFLKAKMYI